MSRVKPLALALVLVLTASLSQAAPAAAAGAVTSSLPRAPAFGGLLGDLIGFLHDLGAFLGSLFGGGGSKGGNGGGNHSGGGHSPGGGSDHHVKPPGHKDPPRWDWNNDWDGKGHKSSYDLWKKWFC